ncbi:MAG: MATE family efflux transporter [Oscillospiraceae bacterium]|jgi:putative MATE family efflux protein
MKQVDYGNDRLGKCIFATSLPMFVAQSLNLLYNIVDRIYIGRIPVYGTAMLGAVGICFPFIIIITAFTNLYGAGGCPLFTIELGKGSRERAQKLLNISFSLEIFTAAVLIIAGEALCEPVLRLFGASDSSIVYAEPYMRIYLLGTFFSMTATGMNPYINALGFPVPGMATVIIGAVSNIVLDPIFIFTFDMGVEGAAWATVISQALSAAFVVIFLAGKKTGVKIRFPSLKLLSRSWKDIKDILGLGTASFVMQITNSLSSIACNRVMRDIGGDIYVSVMTILTSIRQMVLTPINSITTGTSPVLSYNYGAGKYKRTLKCIRMMVLWSLGVMAVILAFLMIFPEFFVQIISSDENILGYAVPAVRIYTCGNMFMTLQAAGQDIFRSLNKKKQAIFFSIFRKVIIVVPLTYILPYWFGMGVNGVYAAEPISDLIGGLACFITMCATVLPELRKKQDLNIPEKS